MLTKKEKKIFLAHLPDEWRQVGADHFNKSISYIEKVAYGLAENLQVFEFLVKLAEDTKQNKQLRQDELKSRIQNLG